ncbi:beta-1,6-N-acetylglucosaminyltransferase [Nostoc sp.]|uniref:beta-1,6-N-acetylglucosaminyltransferase n=1 Tax=Nostoc sp. TaxID=1180 RepID=UPI002FF49E9C
MKIAYIILAHKYPQQLVRLIYKLNTDDISFFIHIDKKADYKIYHHILTQLKDFPNVSFIKRYDLAWGSFDIVRASLKGIKSIVETGTYFDYVIYLSGQDYLIKSNEQIKKFLQENKGREFLEYFPLPCDKWYKGGLTRLESWYIRWKDKDFFIPKKREFKSRINSFLYSLLILLLPKRHKFPEGFALYGGSAFWCLTGESIKWINDFVKQNPKFVNRFNYTYCPDELFYQILIVNSSFKEKIINTRLTYLEWSNVNSLHPKILEKNDFDKIIDSEKLFARKFDMTVDPDILDMIDEMILSQSEKSK